MIDMLKNDLSQFVCLDQKIDQGNFLIILILMLLSGWLLAVLVSVNRPQINEYTFCRRVNKTFATHYAVDPLDGICKPAG